MTVIDERPWIARQPRQPRHRQPQQLQPQHLQPRQPQRPAGLQQVRPRRRSGAVRPAGARPAITPLHYRGQRIAVSRTPHIRRGVSTAVTIGLAGMAALITLWLGFLAQFSGGQAAAPTQPPDRLAVVVVQAGETLQHLAARVAPGASTAAVVDEIRSLNQLDSSALEAGQTLIAPVS